VRFGVPYPENSRPADSFSIDSLTGKDAVPLPSLSGRLSRWLFAALIIAGIGFLALELAPQTIGEMARRHFEHELQKRYPECRVSIRRGSFHKDVGLVFEGIQLAEPSDDGRSRWRDAIRIDRLMVIANIDPEKLAQGEPPLNTQRIVIDGFHLDTRIDDEGEFTATKFWPPPQLGPVAPRIELHDSQLRVFGRPGASHPLVLQLAQILLTNDSANEAMTIAVNGHAEFATRVYLHSSFQPEGLSIEGNLRGIHLNADLLDRLPNAWTKSLDGFRGIDAVVDTTFELSRSAGGQIEYQVRNNIHEARLDHPGLPIPITQIRGLFTCEPGGIYIKTAQGQFGDALFRMSGHLNPQVWPETAKFQVTVDNLLLDDHLARRLPDSLRETWDKLQPYGHIDIERASVEFDHGRWDMNAVIQAKGVNVNYEAWPYPVEQLVGRVEINRETVFCYEMNGRIDGQPMQCAFRLAKRPEINHEKLFVIRMAGPVGIDSTLIESLSPRGQPKSDLESFVRSLHPQGNVHLVHARLETDAAGRESQHIDLRISNGHLRYDNFAYPLYNVNGQIKIEDDLLWLNDFEANNSSAGQVRCRGWYRLPGSDETTTENSSLAGVPALPRMRPPTMMLEFNAQEIPLDGALRSSLSDASKHAWDAISPSGVLDHLDVVVKQGERTSPVTTEITAIQQEAVAITNRTLSLQPPALPYRLDVLNASVRFDGQRVLIDSLSTQHDATRMSADGTCVRDQDGRWNLILNIRGGSRLHPDAELIAALPPQIREAMHRLQLRGPLSIRGETQMLLADERHPEPVVNWNLNLQLEGNRIGDVGPVHSVRGELKTQGRSDADGLRAMGNVLIDSMHIDHLQVTSVQGPFLVDGDRLQLGATSQVPRTGDPNLTSAATQLDSQAVTQTIGGRVFGGELEVVGEVILSSGKFDVVVAIERGQVPVLLADLGQGRSELTGTFNGRTHLQGFLGTTELLKGTGAAQVTGANLYQLPLLVQLLNLLRITPTEDVAFTDGNANFQIIENQITFNQLQLWGDLVALDGAGTLNRRRELDLSFNTRVSPQNTFNRLVRPLQMGKYTLLTVDVRGPVGSPTIQRRALDGVSETLEKLFPVMIPAAENPHRQSNRWLPSILR